MSEPTLYIPSGYSVGAGVASTVGYTVSAASGVIVGALVSVIAGVFVGFVSALSFCALLQPYTDNKTDIIM